MTWMTLSLLTAFAVASQDAWVKKSFSHLSAWHMLAFPLFYSLPFSILAIFWVPVPVLDAVFYWFFVLSIPINAAAFLLYMEAIRVSPLYLTLPYLAFTPTFIIITGFIFLGELPGVWGGVGVIVTCGGSYILNLKTDSDGLMTPLKAVFREKGSWMMIVVALLFSVAAVMGKKAILHSSPAFFTASFFIVHNILVLLLMLSIGKIDMTGLVQNHRRGTVAGALFFFHILCHGYAISMANAAYMISIKRMSILIGMFYGRFFFKEEALLVKYIGAVLMICGAGMIMIMGSNL